MSNLKEKEVKDIFVSMFGNDFKMFAAPGRINIIGEHTDYNNGFVLPAAIDKRICLAIQKVPGHMVTLHSVDFNETVMFNISDHGNELPHWAKYPFGMIKEFEKQGYRSEAFNAVFGGDIPDGAGLSSSAALESVFGVALNQLFNFGLSKMKIALTGQSAEHNYAGVNCGIMDQFASMHGKKSHVVRLDCRSLEFEYYPLELGDYELILVNTLVKHSLAASEYNIRRAECEEGVNIIRKSFPDVHSLRDVSSEIVKQLRKQLSDKVYDRCFYVTEEIERVEKACNNLSEGKLEEVGKLMFQTHKGLSKLYEVSCPELDLLVETAGEIKGVAGARVMGGGFGGCTINLVKSDDSVVFKEKVAASYLKSFGREPIFYHVQTGNGAGEI
jgi:galactokinase